MDMISVLKRKCRRGGLAALVMIMIAAVMAGCSDNSSVSAKLDGYVSDDADIVFTGDLHRLLDQTGCKVTKDGTVELSDYMSDVVSLLPPSARVGLNSVLEAEGVDWSSAVFSATLRGKSLDAMLIMSVSDEKKFADNLADNLDMDVEKEDGAIAVSNDYSAVIVKDKLAFMVLDNGDPCRASKALRRIESAREAASENPLAKWKKKQLDCGKIASFMVDMKPFVELADFAGAMQGMGRRNAGMAQFGMLLSIMKDLRKAYLCYTFDIDGQSMRATGAIFDPEGEPKSIPMGEKINTDMLRYITRADIAVSAWGGGELLAKYVEEFAGTRVPADIMRILQPLKGTVVAGFGPVTDKISDIANNEPGWYHFIVAAEYVSPAAARDALAAAAGLMQAELAADGQTASALLQVGTRENPAADYWDDNYYLPVYMKFFLRADGNVLAVSNADIVRADKSPVDMKRFDGRNFVTVVTLKKDNVLLESFHPDFGVNLYVSGTDNHGTADLSVTGTKKGIVEAFADFAGSSIAR